MTNNQIAVRILSQQDLFDAGCVDITEIVNVVENAFKQYANGDVIFPDKVSVIFDEAKQNRINCLPAAIKTEMVYGMKWVSVFPDNPYEYGRQNVSAVIILSELRTGFPIAFMDGTLCSNLRTAAVGAIGAKYLAKSDARVIGFIGAGEQAKSHFFTMKIILPHLQICKVASRTAETEQKFIKQMSKRFPDVQFVSCNSKYEEAASGADIIVTAISGQEKILRAAWIKKGAFYCHVAGLEDDFDVALKADKIVVDNWEVVKHRTQTISQMYASGLLCDKDIYADLHEIITGAKVGRETEDEFIYFNSVGMAFVDVALANWMYKKAAALDLGQHFMIQDKSLFEMF